MVAEIADFYSEDYERTFSIERESHFNEALLYKANKFLEIMSKFTGKHKGDLVQFNGNSMVTLFPLNELGDPEAEAGRTGRATIKIKKSNS